MIKVMDTLDIISVSARERPDSSSGSFSTNMKFGMEYKGSWIFLKEPRHGRHKSKDNRSGVEL